MAQLIRDEMRGGKNRCGGIRQRLTKKNGENKKENKSKMMTRENKRAKI